MMTTRALTLLLTALLAVAANGCRGRISKEPPLHPVLDMDFQEKVKAQRESKFNFAAWSGGSDHRGMRTPPTGTVARGSLERAQFATYKDAAGQFIANPLPATLANLQRGQDRFNIYCAVCHDRTGGGKGMVMQRAPVGSFNPVMPHLATDERLRGLADGELYQTIAEGKGTMPAYGHMVSVEDRWKIVHYLRALQNLKN